MSLIQFRFQQCSTSLILARLIHLFNKYLLNTYYVPESILSTCDTSIRIDDELHKLSKHLNKKRCLGKLFPSHLELKQQLLPDFREASKIKWCHYCCKRTLYSCVEISMPYLNCVALGKEVYCYSIREGKLMIYL